MVATFSGKSMRLLVTLLLAGFLIVAAGMQAPAVEAVGVSGSWNVVPGPVNATEASARLRSVDAVSSRDVWTVGYDITGHWDGSTWKTVNPARPGNPADLASVAALGSGDVWAVGRRQDTASPYYNKTLTEHWDGQRWSIVASPNGSRTSSELLGVAAVSANDVWAVGDFGASAPMYQRTLIEHWDGANWTIVPSPNASNSSQNALTGVAAVSATDVWAVGYSLTSNNKTLIEHWDGKKWSIVPSPNVGSFGNGLTGVAALGPNDVWAVGSTNNSATTLVLHWNGSTWSVVPSPSVAYWSNILNSVVAVARDDVWAVGTSLRDSYTADGDVQTSTLTLIEHWDGSAWSIVPSPNPGTGNNYYGTPVNQLAGVAAVSTSDVWAVGEYGESDGLNIHPKTLTEHYTAQ